MPTLFKFLGSGKPTLETLPSREASNTGAVQKYTISHHSNELQFLQHFTNE